MKYIIKNYRYSFKKYKSGPAKYGDDLVDKNTCCIILTHEFDPMNPCKGE